MPVGHLAPKNPKDWQKLKIQAKKYVIRQLKKTDLKDVDKQIKFEIARTPLDWEETYNLKKGSTLGLKHNLSQVGYLRPKRQHSKYKNLYFVGASTHPGSGVPTVLLSAHYTSQLILKRTA